jgi:hypothetical protein
MLVERLFEPNADEGIAGEAENASDGESVGEREIAGETDYSGESGDEGGIAGPADRNQEHSKKVWKMVESIEDQADVTKQIMAEVSPLTLQLYVPYGNDYTRLGKQAPSPYASVIRGPRVSIMSTMDDFWNNGHGFRFSRNCQRAYVIGVGRGPRSTGDAPPAIRHCCIQSPIDGDIMTRIALFGKRAATFWDTDSRDDAEFTTRSALGIREEAIGIWRAAAEDESVRPRISLRLALAEAGQVMLALAMDPDGVGSEEDGGREGEDDDLDGEGEKSEKSEEMAAARAMEHIAWGLYEVLRSDEAGPYGIWMVEEVEQRMMSIIDAVRSEGIARAAHD